MSHEKSDICLHIFGMSACSLSLTFFHMIHTPRIYIVEAFKWTHRYAHYLQILNKYIDI